MSFLRQIFLIFLPFCGYFLVLSCSGSFETTDYSAVRGVDPNVHSYLFKKTGKIVFIEIDERRSGMADTWQWVSGDPTNPKNTNVLYRELATKPGRPIDVKTYYGPNNFKIVELQDLNGDGRFETTVYFNWLASPQSISGIIARIESDTDHKPGVDLWIYPMSRMELDTNGDGQPDRFISDGETINRLYAKYVTEGTLSSDGFKVLPPALSWAIHPSLIPEGKNRAIISGSF
ncbi:hypothetical protein LEP1GSC047_3609 [Leptospira inadai serovar Lyme str. 10]|uniref:Lipoprotein n=2 Tax=Leptospira inadai serovar Lyme TaxID=293084 RepID=V6HY05_9LEPT|nr:hypothetical protein LEP1GSC047_3609 [Leptospira inadai serovar Lyme str. 10]